MQLEVCGERGRGRGWEGEGEGEGRERERERELYSVYILVSLVEEAEVIERGDQCRVKE